MKITGSKDTIEWYNQNASHYKKASELSFSINDKNQLDEFISKLPKNAKVLDVGCGSGRDTNFLSQKGIDVIGLDLSKGLIKLASESYKNIKFVVGNMTNLPFLDNEFDGIWSHASLLHLETIEEVNRTITEFNRVLKKSGILHLLVKAQKGNEKTAVVSDKLSGHDRFFQYFKKEEIKKLLINEGFKPFKLEQYNETKGNPNGRPEVDWIISLSIKN